MTVTDPTGLTSTQSDMVWVAPPPPRVGPPPTPATTPTSKPAASKLTVIGRPSVTGSKGKAGLEHLANLPVTIVVTIPIAGKRTTVKTAHATLHPPKKPRHRRP